MIISSSKYNLIHFAHKKNTNDCILKEDSLSEKEAKKLEEIYKSKESDEHKFLKNKIGSLLKKTDGVDQSTVSIDNQYFFSEDKKQKRRPDVYCKYHNKELVFEIQLSPLTQRYILRRKEFYRKRNMYLIWVLENFDKEGQSQMELDLKHLSKHQNFFSLDKSSKKELRLNCDYKKVLNLNNELEVYSSWRREKILLSQLSFDEENYQCYYYNFKENEGKFKVETIINEIKTNHRNGYVDYEEIHSKINNLENEEIDILNDTLQLTKLKPEGKPVLNYWICEAKNYAFINFLLECELINIDVNSTGPKGKSPFQEILLNDNISGKEKIIKNLFIRGYKFSESDKKAVLNIYGNGAEAEELIIACNLASSSPPRIIRFIFDHKNLFCILESIRQTKIMGYNYKANEWIAFINNAIDNYQPHWFYIESALKSYDLWDRLLALDKNGTFHRKLDDFHSQNTKPDNFDSNIGYLYPEAYQKLKNE